MTEQEIRDRKPDGATHKITSAGHDWYLKKNLWTGWLIYHRHHWLVYDGSIFNFNLDDIKPL